MLASQFCYGFQKPARLRHTPAPSAANVISHWLYTRTVPPNSDENVRLNLWLYQGHAPNNSYEVEVVIRSFQFVPLGARLPSGHP